MALHSELQPEMPESISIMVLVSAAPLQFICLLTCLGNQQEMTQFCALATQLGENPEEAPGNWLEPAQSWMLCHMGN